MSDEADSDEAGHEGTELERSTTREEAATLLHDLADGVASGSVAFDDGAAVAEVPGTLDLEVEYERDDEEAEIEVELAWDTDTGGEEADDADVTGDEGASPDAAAVEDSGVDAAAPGGQEGTRDERAADGSVLDGLVEPAEAARSRARFELYRDGAGEWRWRLVHHNGNIIADGGEGYDRKRSARNGLESVKHNAPGAEVVERE